MTKNAPFTLAALVITLVIVPSQAWANSMTKVDFAIINQCSNAARIVVMSVEKSPSNREERSSFSNGLFEELKKQGKFGKDAPSEIDLLIAQSAVESLISQGASPVGAQGHDWFLSQASATCALQRRFLRNESK